MRSAVSSASITRSRSVPAKRNRSWMTCRMRRSSPASFAALPFLAPLAALPPLAAAVARGTAVSSACTRV
ncbi:hypothetical protein G6F62_015712 [Rhizopus arrhizus]|nr:hypothetical protein G6F62_015712 [Rhizopus arrhizus]